MELSEEKAYNLAYSEWVGVITQLWTAIGQPVDVPRLNVYIKNLRAVPMGILEESIKQLMIENTYNSVPSLGSIWDVIKRLFGRPDEFSNWTPMPSARRELIYRLLILKKMDYEDYLETPEWQVTRDLAKERVGFRCEKCGSDNYLHVHHLSYKRRGEELPEDLEVLCKACHEKLHGIKVTLH